MNPADESAVGKPSEVAYLHDSADHDATGLEEHRCPETQMLLVGADQDLLGVPGHGFEDVASPGSMPTNGTSRSRTPKSVRIQIGGDLKIGVGPFLGVTLRTVRDQDGECIRPVNIRKRAREQ